MKKFILLLFLILLIAVNQSYAARIYPSPEVPNITCADGIDNDADGLVDAADPDCVKTATFSSDGGNGYRANFKDAIITGYSTVADSTAGSGTYLKKTSSILGYRIGRGAFWANFTNATYYVWIRYRCSETNCAIWLSDSPLLGDLNNATQGMSLPNKSSFDWIQVRFAGTNIDFKNGKNAAVNNATFALNGNKGIFFANTDGLELDGIVLDPDSGTTPDCVNTGCTQPTFNYEILELGAAATPTDCSSTAFTNANIMTWQGFDNTNLTATAKILWKNTGNKPFYICVEPNDTDDEIASTTNDIFSTQEDGVDFRWRPDTAEVFDLNLRMVDANLYPIYSDADWSGSANTRTFTPNFNTTVAKTISAGVSWKIFITADGGSSITAGNTGLCNLVIRDKDTGTTATLKHFFGTTNNAMLNANEFGRCKWSATTVPGGGDSTAPTVNTTAETNIVSTGATITFNTNEAGNAFVIYGTSTGSYTLTSAISPCTSACVITLTGLSPSTTYYYRAKVTDAANNTGQSAEDTVATLAASGTHFIGATAQGSANCSDNSNRCLPANVWKASTGAHRDIVAGDTIVMADGTYACSACIIQPPSGLNGTAANPITIKALNDGAVKIDGQGSRRPVTLSNNDYFIITGFNVCCSGTNDDSVFSLRAGADNNKVQRIIGWDANIAGNTAIFNAVGGGTGNLFEDVAGFGTARKIFGPCNDCFVRRAWGQWEASTRTGPKMVFTHSYNTYGEICENCIGTWNMPSAASPSESRGFLSMDREDGDHCSRSKYLGSMGYTISSQIYPTSWESGSYIGSDTDCVEFKDVTWYIDPTHSGLRPFNGQKFTGGVSPAINCTTCERRLINITEVGGTASIINSDPTNGITVTNRSDTDTIAAMNSAGANPFQSTAGTGARMCFRYVNGVLTTTKLWPWPMNQRIIDAMTAAGKTPVDVTATMETIFGTIPAACKN